MFLNDLTRRLGFYPPREVDLWLWQCGKYHYPILVSQAVPGKTLQQSLEENRYFNFNTYAFSQSVLISTLTNLEDNKPDNLIVVSENSKDRLVLIDADRWFAPAFKNKQLHIKDIIFCLDAMSTPVDRTLCEEILCLNPQELLNAWVTEIKRLGELTIKIFGKKINDYQSGVFQAEHEKSLLLPPLKFHTVNELFQNLQKLQDFFKQSAQENRIITHWDLLHKINPQLANHYKSFTKTQTKPLERFNKVTEHAYTKIHGERTTCINFKTQQEYMWEGLPKAGNLQESWHRDIKNVQHQLQGLSVSYDNIQVTKERLRLDSLQHFSQIPGKEKVLAELDFGDLSSKTQDA